MPSWPRTRRRLRCGTRRPFLGGLHYWWPKMTGKMYPESVANLCVAGVFFGFNLTFLPQFVMGSRGMPRRYWDYDPEFTIYHQLSTIGALVLGLSLFFIVIYLIASFIKGKPATDNPWGATTLEWQAPTPPTEFNFPHAPEVYPLYYYDDLIEQPDGNWIRREGAPTAAAMGDHH